MGHVDAFSSHVGTVIEENALDNENVLREQAKDAFWAKQSTENCRSKQEFVMVFCISGKQMVNTNWQYQRPWYARS